MKQAETPTSFLPRAARGRTKEGELNDTSTKTLSGGLSMVKIDADANVLETEKSWEYMEGTDRKYRPQIVGCTDGSSNDEYWLVDGTLRLKSRNVGKNTPMASRELRDVSVR